MARRIAHKLESQWRSDDVLQTDENATFKQFLLSDQVLSGLSKSGFVRPSPIQVEAIPLGLCGFDLVVQAKSGTGKTCVFSTLALQAVDVSKNAVQVLILAPTREIAVQSCDTVCCIGCDVLGLKAYAFIGGVPISEDLRKLSRCHVAAGTLGRLLQLVKQGELRLNHAGLVVLDEADQLLDESFQGDLRELWSRLPPKRQVVATSATYSPEVARILEEELLHKPAIVRLCGEQQENRPTLLGLTEWYCVAKGTAEAAWFSRKVRALVEVLRKLAFSQCLVFLNSQARAQSLVERLSYHGFRAQLLSGAQEQSDRLKALVNLKAFRCRILVSTDLAARGIDAERVNLVINFDVARSLDTHLHRSGRAGRYGTAGQTVTIVTGRSELNQLLQLCSPLEQDIKPLPGFPSLEPGDGETEVNGDAPEDDPENYSVDGDAAEDSSGNIGVNDVADKGHVDDCRVRDGRIETDPEVSLEGMLLLFAKDASVTAAKDEVPAETEDLLQIPTEPSLTLAAGKDEVLPETGDRLCAPTHPSPRLTAAKDVSPETEDCLQVPTELSQTLSAAEDEVLPGTPDPPQTLTDPSSALAAAKDEILPESLPTLTAGVDEVLQVFTEPILTLTAAKNDVLPETLYHLQVPAEHSLMVTAVKDISLETEDHLQETPTDPSPALTAAKDVPPEIEDPPQLPIDPSPAPTAAEDRFLLETMYPHVPTNLSPTVTAQGDEFLPGTTYLLQLLTDSLQTQNAAEDEVLSETEDPIRVLDPFVECQQPAPTGTEPTPNSQHWCNLSWPPEPSVGIELAAHLDTAEETFRRSFEGSGQLEQMVVAAIKDYLSFFPSHAGAEGLDAHMSPEDDVASVHRAVAADDELSFTYEQCCEPSSVAVNSEAAGTGKSCVSPDLSPNTTSITLESEGLSSIEARENIRSVPNEKAATCETLPASQLHQEAGQAALDSDASAAMNVASDESFTSCYSCQEPSVVALGSEGVSIVQAQADGIALDLKPVTEEAWKQGANLGTLNSDVTSTEVAAAARKKGPTGPKAPEDLRVPSLSHTLNEVTCSPDVKMIAGNRSSSSQDRWKREKKLDAADVKCANVSREEHPLSRSLCWNSSGSRFDSNKLNQTKRPEKSSTEGQARKRKSTAAWIMERSNLTGAEMDVTAVCSRQGGRSLSELKLLDCEQVDVGKDGKVTTLPKKKPILATTNVNSFDRVRNDPGTTGRKGRQPKVNTSSGSEESDGRLSVQLERPKQTSCSGSSQARCSGTTYFEHPATVVTNSPSHCTQRGPMSRTDMCDQCARKCDAIRAACCEAQRSLRETAVSSSWFPYSRTQVHASAWFQNWFHWYQWYIREMLRVNDHQ
ncbi:uncharacterized protein LOC144152981 [Haemaphysalis longicornis]